MKPEDLIPTRHSLVRRLKNWDDSASWEELFNTYWRLIYGVAIKSGLTEQEAQDVVQETFVSLAKNIQAFRVGAEHGSFKSWLLGMTRWRIADQFRRRKRLGEPAAGSKGEETARTATVERVPDPASLETELMWENEWRQNIMEVAMERVRSTVNPISYQMFDLHVLKGWPANKTARKLNVSMGQVYFARYKVARLIKKEVKRLEAKLV